MRLAALSPLLVLSLFGLWRNHWASMTTVMTDYDDMSRLILRLSMPSPGLDSRLSLHLLLTSTGL